VSEETSLAIPVRAKDRVLATVSVRYAATAVPLRTAVEQFLPKMRDAVAKIEREFGAAEHAA
jgi:DNA-binding IclR family transcriptional regulator